MGFWDLQNIVTWRGEKGQEIENMFGRSFNPVLQIGALTAIAFCPFTTGHVFMYFSLAVTNLKYCFYIQTNIK